MSTATAAAPVRRARPKDRRQQIAMAAALAFSERGYHQVSLSEVAAAVGISASALYRHFPNKYALFLDAAERLARGLVEATDGLGDTGDPERDLDDVVRSLAETTVGNRLTGGLYRWEGRYLEDADRARLRAEFAELNARVRRPIAALRPDLPAGDDAALAAAVLSVVASITSHRTRLSTRRIVALLVETGHRVALVDLPPASGERVAATPGLPSASKRETLIREAITLFHAKGYHETAIEDVSAAAGLTASGLYRHFSGKSDLLLEACVRAAERLGATTEAALEGAPSEAEGLDRLVDAYVAHSFAHHELMSVYFSDSGALPHAELERLRDIQRRHVDEWVALLRAVRPDLGAAEARFHVHAGLNIVVDLGRLVHWDESPATLARVAALVRAALGVADQPVE
ncbi:TetR/AcrR family transcriptional regulator [Agromyces seonyuensis]|uniref:TetR family transcriptional regulator n=1 Tax=Agromyces seonyuensis TaxID=2662446 RepID=A0A6I4P6H8_9MICO|nr:TetR/AcrR family transcriptional regulator [Agromyces seonyuensis]MWC00210.1 TetR family transcriptional regulator [Agromyces seonyuensis]